MSEAYHEIGGDDRLLIVADHASAHVPADIDLGIAPALLANHIAVDIGVAPLAIRLCALTGCGAILGGVSRLVIDYNREEPSPSLIVHASDGHPIPGNDGLDPAGRLARFWRPYHAAVAARIAATRPTLLVSLHSFTPMLETCPAEPRPWQVGVLYNRDERAARVAIPLLEAAGVVTGDNQPYSGRTLNATMNRHGEANGIPYIGLEVRQDLLGDAAGMERWAAILAPIVTATLEGVGRSA